MNDRQTSTASDPLVRAYLQQLERALSALPQDERAVIVDEVTEHIVESLETRDAPYDPAQVRAVLDALGDPVAIATEAGSSPPLPATGQRPPFLERRSGGLVIVLLLLIGGLVVPVLGWFAGVVMLWASRGWSTLQKLVGTLVLPGGLLGVVILGSALPALLWSSTTTESGCETTAGVDSIECVELGPIIQTPEWSWVVLVILLVLQVAASAYLLSRFHTATDRDTHLPYAT